MGCREIVIDGDTAFVPLTRGYVALIDAAVVGQISRWSWQALPDRRGQIYAARSSKTNGRKKLVRMHRAILGALDDQDVDHVNGNKLDNRKVNLRIATRSENSANRRVGSRNTSGFKGVHRSGARWRATIRVDGKSIHLGRFDTPEEAHSEYMKSAQRLFGEFARSS